MVLVVSTVAAAAAVEPPVAGGASVVATFSGSLVLGCSGVSTFEGVADVEDVLAFDTLGYSSKGLCLILHGETPRCALTVSVNALPLRPSQPKSPSHRYYSLQQSSHQQEFCLKGK